MTTFVTGGTSSIGRVLVRELAQDGKRVRVMVRPSSLRSGLDLPGVEFAVGDVTDAGTVRRAMDGCERVCHLAAVVAHRATEPEWWQVNHEGTRAVLRAARDLGVRSFVQVSSIAVLGPTAPGEVADESRPVDTASYMNLYQRTKRAADDAAREYAAEGLRAMVVYPGAGWGCSISSSHPTMAEMTLLRMAAGKLVAIPGDGRRRLCLSYFKDTARGILLAHERGLPGESYILGCANLSFTEIWRDIAEILRRRPPRLRIPTWAIKAALGAGKLLPAVPPIPPDVLANLNYDWCFSSAKAERELGWKPIPFRAAVAETWDEYRANGWPRA